MGQEIPEQKADETSTSTSINPTAHQDGAPVPLRDDAQSVVPEAVKAGRDVQSLKSSSEGQNHQEIVSTADMRSKRIRNVAPNGPRKKRREKHDCSEALEYPGREALAQFLATPRSLREFGSYNDLAKHFEVTRMTIFRWKQDTDVIERAVWLCKCNQMIGDLFACQAWPRIMQKVVEMAIQGNMDAIKFCPSRAWAEKLQVAQSQFSLSVLSEDLFGTDEGDETEEVQDAKPQAEEGSR